MTRPGSKIVPGRPPTAMHSQRITLALLFVLAASACTGSFVLDQDAVQPPELAPPPFAVAVLAGDDLSPLPADVRIGGITVDVDARGVAHTIWPEQAVTVAVDAPGFRPWEETVEARPPGGTLEVRLEPVILAGRITSQEGVALPGVTVELGGFVDLTNDDGRFQIERATAGDIRMTRPAWQPRTEPWDGVIDEIEVTMEPLLLRAVRAGADVVADPAAWERLLGLTQATGVDAIVVDLKDELGTVLYDTDVAAAGVIGAVRQFFDLDQVVSDLDDHGLYKIGRLVAFQDPPLATAEPDLAVIDTATGEPWETRAGHRWLDPSDPASFEYVVSLAEEACRRGMDEIQFDYVSFPIGGDLTTAAFDGDYTEEVRVTSIVAFLERAYSVLSPMGCAVGANVLAITLESGSDEGVGQRPGVMSRTIDVLNPMLYTTNYGPGWKGFADPNENSLEIVDGALAEGVTKLEGFGYYRPWLQTWTLAASDIRRLQEAAESRGMGWMLWSNSAAYPPGILPPG